MKKNILFDVSKILTISVSFIIIYVPVIMIILMSFTNSYSLSTLGVENGFTLKWYGSLFTNNYSILDIANKYVSNIESLKRAILNTFAITFLSTLISTILGTVFAIGIHSFSKKIRTSLMVLNNMPVIMPDIVTGFLLLLVFVLFETLFGLSRGFVTVLIAHVFFSIPYVVLSVLPRLNQIDENTYEAARDLGCSRMGAVVKAIIPSIMTGIVAGAMFAFTMSIDDFVITMFVSGTKFYNVSTWIDSGMRRGFIPKTVYAYNVIIFTIAAVSVIVSRLNGYKKAQEKSKI
ncbi:MAG: ABC transporter permease [Gammaproteobacteria bacterium]|nr:ABC transporter permease [Gammaproteobacteria bacterium]